MARNIAKRSTLAAVSAAMLMALGGIGSPATAAADDELTPKPPPELWFDPALDGLTSHIRDRTGAASQCTYLAVPTVRWDGDYRPAGDPYERNFFLPANSTYDLKMSAVPLHREWFVYITCDNLTQTKASTFF